jgi:hypothetical protein
MIRSPLLTRDRWAWQCQCNAEVLPVSVFLHGSSFHNSPLTHSLLQIPLRSSSETGISPALFQSFPIDYSIRRQAVHSIHSIPIAGVSAAV